MTDTTRIRVCAANDISPGEAKRFDVDGHRVCVVRIDDDFYAIGDQCSHEDYSLAEGEVFADECAIECWKHGSTFDLRTGEPQSLPATKPVPAYEVIVDRGEVFVR